MYNLDNFKRDDINIMDFNYCTQNSPGPDCAGVVKFSLPPVNDIAADAMVQAVHDLQEGKIKALSIIGVPGVNYAAFTEHQSSFKGGMLQWEDSDFDKLCDLIRTGVAKMLEPIPKVWS
jgi:hypothetical protein